MRFYNCVCENEKSHGNNKLLFFFALHWQSLSFSAQLAFSPFSLFTARQWILVVCWEMHLLKYNKVCAQMVERFTLGRFFAGATASKSHGKLAAGITALTRKDHDTHTGGSRKRLFPQRFSFSRRTAGR
jgi:hypothetical protein